MRCCVPHSSRNDGCFQTSSCEEVGNECACFPHRLCSSMDTVTLKEMERICRWVASLKRFLNFLKCIFVVFYYIFLEIYFFNNLHLPVSLLQGFELLLSALGDPSERVVSATHQVFLPAYAAWTTELGNLQSHLIPTLLNKIEKLLRVSSSF